MVLLDKVKELRVGIKNKSHILLQNAYSKKKTHLYRPLNKMFRLKFWDL